MKELFDAISQVGFPIVVAIFLLIRVEQKMEKLGDKIDTFSEVITKLTVLIEERLRIK